MSYVKWECCHCKDIVISNSKRRQTMDFCKCGISGCDLEEDYCRWEFDKLCPALLYHYDYNFFDEILLCMDKQGFEPFIKLDKLYIDSTTVYLIRELEDKILESLK